MSHCPRLGLRCLGGTLSCRSRIGCIRCLVLHQRHDWRLVRGQQSRDTQTRPTNAFILGGAQRLHHCSRFHRLLLTFLGPSIPCLSLILSRLLAIRPPCARCTSLNQRRLTLMPFGYSAPKRRRTSGSGQWAVGQATRLPESLPATRRKKLAKEGCAANELSQTQFLAGVRLGLKAQSAEDLTLVISDRNPRRIPPSSPRLPRGTSCPWGKHIRGKNPTVASSGESPEETEAGESPAPLPVRRLLFGSEYPKGIGTSPHFSHCGGKPRL